MTRGIGWPNPVRMRTRNAETAYRPNPFIGLYRSDDTESWYAETAYYGFCM